MSNKLRPPGPAPGAMFRLLPTAFRNQAEFLLQLAHSCGELTYLNLGVRSVCIVNSPEIAGAILDKDQDNFSNWISRFMTTVGFMRGRGILATEYEGHAYRRSLVAPTFMPEHVQRFGGIITDYGVRIRDGWSEGRIFDIEAEMGRLSLLISVRLLFGLDMESEAPELRSILARFMTHYKASTLPRLMFQNILGLLPFGNAHGLKRAKDDLERYIQSEIETRKNDVRKRHDVLASMMSAKDGQGREGAMSEGQLIDECVSMLLAGHDPMAKALTWTWYLLSQNTDCELRMHSEIDSVLKGRTPLVSDIENLNFTYDVFKEAMRLYPPIWIMARQAIEEYNIGEYTIPAGCMVLVSPYIIHRNPAIYSNATVFRPDRWSPEEAGSRPEYSYIPFGGGRRVCTGEPLSWIQGVLLLAVTAQKWKIRTVEGYPVRLKPYISLGTKDGIKITVKERA